MFDEDGDRGYDLRQLQLMREFLHSYRKGILAAEQMRALRILIDNLNGLLYCLREVSQDWQEAFQKAWGTLEEVYAVALVEQGGELDEADQQWIEVAVTQLLELVSAAIEEREREDHLP